VGGVLKPHVRVDALAVVVAQEGVGTEEVDFGLRAEDVRDDSGGVLVGKDFGREPFYTSIII